MAPKKQQKQPAAKKPLKKRMVRREPTSEAQPVVVKRKISDDKLLTDIATAGEANALKKANDKREQELRPGIVEGLLERKPPRDASKPPFSVQSGGYKATLVEPQAGEYLDADMLKKKLGAEKWNKVTTTVLDRQKLDALIALEEIDPTVVAQCTTQGVPGNPYVKFSKE